MHFISTSLLLALSLATTTLASPRRGPITTTDLYNQPTTTGPYGSENTATGSLPAQCSMFKQYVPEIVLDAVCSLHMNPGAVPSLNSACFGGGSINTFVRHQNAYEAATTQRGGGYEAPTTTQYGRGYTQAAATTALYEDEEQVTTTALGGGYGAPTTTDDGYDTVPTTTATY